MPAVVINTCFGGFSLSGEAVAAISARKNADVDEYAIPRDDKDLVAVVREMGPAARGSFAALKIVEVPDGVAWHIDEYDGSEHVAENHRTWH